MRVRWSAMFLLVTTLAWAAEPEIEFNGVTGNGKEYQLLLKAKAGEPQWVAVGQTFAGYVVSSYEPKEETAVLAKDGRQVRVRLRDAKVASGMGAALPQNIREGITRNLRMIAAAAYQYFQETGATSVSPDVLLAPDKYIKGLEVQAGENYRTMEIVYGKTLQVTTASGHTVVFMP